MRAGNVRWFPFGTRAFCTPAAPPVRRPVADRDHVTRCERISRCLGTTCCALVVRLNPTESRVAFPAVNLFLINSWHHASRSMRSWESARAGHVSSGTDSQDRKDLQASLANMGKDCVKAGQRSSTHSAHDAHQQRGRISSVQVSAVAITCCCHSTEHGSGCRDRQCPQDFGHDRSDHVALRGCAFAGVTATSSRDLIPRRTMKPGGMRLSSRTGLDYFVDDRSRMHAFSEVCFRKRTRP